MKIIENLFSSGCLMQSKVIKKRKNFSRTSLSKKGEEGIGISVPHGEQGHATSSDPYSTPKHFTFHLSLRSYRDNPELFRYIVYFIHSYSFSNIFYQS